MPVLQYMSISFMNKLSDLKWKNLYNWDFIRSLLNLDFKFDFLSFSPFLSFSTLVTELWAYAAYALGYVIKVEKERKGEKLRK